MKEAPEMLAFSQWTGQIPRRPQIPEGCSATQLIALGSRRKRSKVYWMLAKSEQEVSEWMEAITKTVSSFRMKITQVCNIFFPHTLNTLKHRSILIDICNQL